MNTNIREVHYQLERYCSAVSERAEEVALETETVFRQKVDLSTEEAGVGETNIRTRLKFRPVEDNAEAHKMLGVTHLHWGRRKIQRTWRSMCHIMLRLEGR